VVRRIPHQDMAAVWSCVCMGSVRKAWYGTQHGRTCGTCLIPCLCYHDLPMTSSRELWVVPPDPVFFHSTRPISPVSCTRSHREVFPRRRSSTSQRRFPDTTSRQPDSAWERPALLAKRHVPHMCHWLAGEDTRVSLRTYACTQACRHVSMQARKHAGVQACRHSCGFSIDNMF